MKQPVFRLSILALCGIIILGLVSILPNAVTPPRVAEAQTGCWAGQYYNNNSFSGSPTATTSCEGAINFAYGASGPSQLPGVVDNFSIRWTSPQTLTNVGTYTFTVTVEDGVRVTVGTTTIINQIGADLSGPTSLSGFFNNPTANQSVSIMVEFQALTGNAQIALSWFSSGTATATSSTGSPWNVEYFNNTSVLGTPIAFSQVAAGPLNINWDLTAPAIGVPADAWSARFTKVIDFGAGGYFRFEGRVDDIFTVRLDGVPIIASTPYFQDFLYNATLQVAAGQHTLTIEMVDFERQAYLQFNWFTTNPQGTPVSGTATGGTPGVTGVTGTVNANVGLNLRQTPSTTGTKLALLPKGATYPIVGRSADGVWAQLNVNGQIGWALAQWLTFTGDFNSVPVTDGGTAQAATAGPTPTPTPIPGGVQVRAVGNVRIRSCPSTRCARLSYVPWGSQVFALGESNDKRWIKIRYTDPRKGEVVGWSLKAWFFNNDFTLPLPELPTLSS
ncbi:MAG: SH3 domain-containing protein [Chloroflexi bacterium]|nr:SH3 domain-containing protein [Chloroflexota bacterium]